MCCMTWHAREPQPPGLYIFLDFGCGLKNHATAIPSAQSPSQTHCFWSSETINLNIKTLEKSTLKPWNSQNLNHSCVFACFCNFSNFSNHADPAQDPQLQFPGKAQALRPHHLQTDRSIDMITTTDSPNGGESTGESTLTNTKLD